MFISGFRAAVIGAIESAAQRCGEVSDASKDINSS